MKRRSDKTLKVLLDGLYENRSQRHLANDPLSFCHRFASPEDREITGLIASSFAYGRVSIILNNLETVFRIMGDSPRRFVETFDPQKGLKLFSAFRHRFNDGRDLCALLLAARTMIEESDTIGEFFLSCYDPAEPDLTGSMTRFTAAVLSFDYTPVFGGPIPRDSYFSYLFPSPAGGSACKRLCMFLRWMIRPVDGIDLGLWHGIPQSKLIIPVDAHIGRIARHLGLTARKQADWRTAQEITARLRKLDPDDPVKYDFSLCHLGISEGCGSRDAACLECSIASLCSGAR